MSTKTSAVISPTTVLVARWGAALVFVTAVGVGWTTEANGWSMVATNITLTAAVIAAFVAIALVTTRCIQLRLNRTARLLAKMETRMLVELQHTRQSHYATLAEAKQHPPKPALKSV